MYNGLAVAVIRGICTESATCAQKHMARGHRQVAHWSGSLPRLHVVCKGAATESKQAQMPAFESAARVNRHRKAHTVLSYPRVVNVRDSLAEELTGVMARKSKPAPYTVPLILLSTRFSVRAGRQKQDRLWREGGRQRPFRAAPVDLRQSGKLHGPYQWLQNISVSSTGCQS